MSPAHKQRTILRLTFREHALWCLTTILFRRWRKSDFSFYEDKHTLEYWIPYSYQIYIHNVCDGNKQWRTIILFWVDRRPANLNWRNALFPYCLSLYSLLLCLSLHLISPVPSPFAPVHPHNLLYFLLPGQSIIPPPPRPLLLVLLLWVYGL